MLCPIQSLPRAVMASLRIIVPELDPGISPDQARHKAAAARMNGTSPAAT